MTNPFITPKLLDDVRDELAGTYSNSGIEDRQPSPEEVIRSALIEIATELRLAADEQSECNKVDECTAGTLVRYRLADWLTVPKHTGKNTGAHDLLDDAVLTACGIWRGALESSKHVPVRRLLPDLARALDRLVDLEGEAS